MVARTVNSRLTRGRAGRTYCGPVKPGLAQRLPLTDLALAAVLATVAMFETWLPMSSAVGEGSRGWTAALALVACAALVVRRTHPLAAALVVLLCWPVVYTFTPLVVLFWGQFVPIAVALYSVARHGTSRQGLLGALAGAGTLLYFDLRVAVLGDPGEIVFHWLVAVLAWGVGRFVRSYDRRAHHHADRAELAESTSREQALQAVAEERARIARELHDIVAHSVSVMVVQAGAARQALDDPAFVGSALDSIRSTGTSALEEMRRVVALIRDTEATLDLSPQPDLADLERLVAEMQVPTSLRVEGAQRPLSAGVALSAFRIVQEALTNVRRHSSARSVEVTLRYVPDGLEIEIVDDGVGTARAAGGNGLIGMRERAQMYGGSVVTTSAPGEGFRVSAVLPMVAT